MAQGGGESGSVCNCGKKKRLPGGIATILVKIPPTECAREVNKHIPRGMLASKEKGAVEDNLENGGADRKKSFAEKGIYPEGSKPPIF